MHRVVIDTAVTDPALSSFDYLAVYRTDCLYKSCYQGNLFPLNLIPVSHWQLCVKWFKAGLLLAETSPLLVVGGWGEVVKVWIIYCITASLIIFSLHIKKQHYNQIILDQRFLNINITLDRILPVKNTYL